MSFLRDAAFTAIGYGLNSLVHSNERKNSSNKYDNLEDLILDYAHKHDVYGRDQDFYRKLMRVAEQFKDPYSSNE